MNTPYTSPLLLTRAGGIATLTLNQPTAMNALDVAMPDAVLAACKSLKDDPELRVVVICGAGKVFGVGGDLTAFQPGSGLTPADPGFWPNEAITTSIR